MSSVHRISLLLSIEGAGRLAALAREGDTTQAEVMRRALTTYDYLKESGGTVQVVKPNGDVVEVELP